MNETWTKLLRRCDVVQIPYANWLSLPAGTEVAITQSSSAAFTITTRTGQKLMASSVFSSA